MRESDSATSPPFKALLITGGAGFVGSNFVRFILQHKPSVTVVALDCLGYSGNLDNLHAVQNNGRFRFVEGNICDAMLLEQVLPDCDVVVHFAAESHVDRSIIDSQPFVYTNVLGTQTLLDAARRCDIERFVHISTDEVYGSLPLNRPDLAFTEESRLRPNNPYAASKAASDLLVRAAHETFGLDVIITRCSNNFGPYQFPEKVIPLFITNLIDGRPLPLYGHGCNVRDWIHVDDHCEAVLAVLDRGRSGEVYNVGGCNERSNLELAGHILQIMGKGNEYICRVADRPAHDLRYAMDISKIRRELGWHPTRSAWPDALEETVRWYIENSGWWRRVKNRVGLY